MVRTLIIMIFFTCISRVQAQQLVFKTYTVQDGLVANAIRSVKQDSRGFLWVATWEGLSKYDGHSFINYTTSNGLSWDLVNDIYELPGGRFLVAENDGSLDIIDMNGNIRRSDFEKVVINRFIETNNAVFAITDDKGLITLENGRFRTVKNIPEILHFIKLNDSISIYIDGGDFNLFFLDKDYNSFLPSIPNIASVKKDNFNNTWLCTQNGLLLLDSIQIRGKPARFRRLPAIFDSPLLKNRGVLDLFHDADRNYWLSTLDGLILVQPDGAERLFTTKDGLPTNYVSRLFQDREKNIWMPSESGLSKLSMKANVLYFPQEDLAPRDRATSLTAGPGNSIYILNGLGTVQRISEGSKAELVATPRNIPNETYFQIIESRGQFYALSNLRVHKVDQNNKRLIPLMTANANDNFWGITTDKEGNIFVGGMAGVYILTPQSASLNRTIPYRITAVCTDSSGYIWVGTWSHGLFRFKPSTNSDRVMFAVEDMSNFLPEKLIRSLFCDSRNNVWIGTRNRGVVLLKQSGAGHLEKQLITRDHGLSSNFIRSFAEDKDKNIWVGTYQGLNKVSGNNYNQVFNINRLYDQFGVVTSINAGFKGYMWLVGSSGLFRFRDVDVNTLPAHPVFFTRIMAGKTGKSILNTGENGKELRLTHTNNQVYFEFASPTYINEKETHFSYRLLGSGDTSWSKPSKVPFVSMASLKPGSYSFEVRSLGWNGYPGTASAFHFFISPPFWQRWWFYVLAFILLLIGTYSLYRYRVRQLLKIERVRNRIATDLHDDIGSTLTNISILSELSNKNLKEPNEAKKYIERITEEVNASGQALDDIIWSVNSSNDTIEDMLVRMRRFAAELFDHTEARCHLHLQASAAGKKLNMEQRRDIYLIYKESLNNIYKHANAKHISVELSLVKHMLRLLIRDDGIGFDPGTETSRNGLKNMNARVTKWNGEMQIETKRGKGTELLFTLPVN